MLTVFGLFGDTDRPCKYGRKARRQGKPLPKWSKWSGTKLQRQLSTSRRTCWLATLMCRWTSFDLWGGLIRGWSFSHLYFLTEIDQITISNYRHSHSGSPSTRDWRLPGKLCQLNNNFCNQIQINFVQEDQSKNLESILCLILHGLRGQMANQTMTMCPTSNIWTWWFRHHLYKTQTNDKCLLMKVLCESMRVYPPIPLHIGRWASRETTICGKTIPRVRIVVLVVSTCTKYYK